MWLLRAVKGWISIHHRSFSVALHLSVWFRQTVCQEYANFGVLLEEVDEPLGVPMDKRMSKKKCFSIALGHTLVVLEMH